MRDIILGIVYIFIAIGLFVSDKVSLGHMSPYFDGVQKYFITGILIIFGLTQIYYGYEKMHLKD
ncbi:MAG TPA: hypothetical protein ENK68_05375 [Epsilonproteobacteria bacterium]|nr:hypothetical protein [Campylobacterota bacterium]